MNQKLYEEIKDTLNKKPKKGELIGLLQKILDEEKGIYEDNEGKCRMISLDTSSTKSGWAYFEAGELVLSGELDYSKEKDSEIRVEEMIMSIYKVLSTYNPDIIVAEKNTVGRNARTERMLGHIVGSVKGYALAFYKEFTTLSPTEWRKAVKKDFACPRKREEAKECAIKMVKDKYGIDVSDNQAEAILIGDALVEIRK